MTHSNSSDGTRVYQDGIRQKPYDVEDRVQVGPLPHMTGEIVAKSREVYADGRKPHTEYDVRMDDGRLLTGQRPAWFTRLMPRTHGNPDHRAAYEEVKGEQ